MAIVIEIKKGATENSASVLRRFTRRVQETGLLQKVKKNRYNERDKSKLSGKKSALKKLVRAKEFTRLQKLGKVTIDPKRRR
jgi:ribosomal protein S21